MSEERRENSDNETRKGVGGRVGRAIESVRDVSGERPTLVIPTGGATYFSDAVRELETKTDEHERHHPRNRR